ncbi:hypothetical protein ACVWWO_003145 [Bradyrhizobium sp. F1.13.1]
MNERRSNWLEKPVLTAAPFQQAPASDAEQGDASPEKQVCETFDAAQDAELIFGLSLL